ncbi:MAG: hypothetical protein ACREFP_01010 [Acetobacteraceae bacterium]
MSESRQTDQVTRDLGIIVGGNFTPHALLGEFTAILERLHATPGSYLDAFQQDYLAPAWTRELSRICTSVLSSSGCIRSLRGACVRSCNASCVSTTARSLSLVVRRSRR